MWRPRLLIARLNQTDKWEGLQAACDLSKMAPSLRLASKIVASQLLG